MGESLSFRNIHGKKYVITTSNKTTTVAVRPCFLSIICGQNLLPTYFWNHPVWHLLQWQLKYIGGVKEGFTIFTQKCLFNINIGNWHLFEVQIFNYFFVGTYSKYCPFLLKSLYVEWFSSVFKKFKTFVIILVVGADTIDRSSFYVYFLKNNMEDR